MQFYENLSDLRRRAGKRQRQVAADLGISQALLSHYENGTREPGLCFLNKVCDYYGVTADYLLGRSENRNMVSASEINALAADLKHLSEKMTAIAEGKK